MVVQATLADGAIAVPGDVTSCRILVRNTAEVADRVVLEVLGEASPWASVRPRHLDLGPGDEGEADISLSVPRSWRQVAGAVAIDVRVRSVRHPGRPALAQGVVRVAPFSDVTARLEPSTSHTTREAVHLVTVENRGNTPVQATVALSGVDAGLAVEAVEPPTLTVAPGRSAVSHLRLRCRRPSLLDASRAHNFTVVVHPAGTPPVCLTGTVSQQPFAWAARGAVATMALVVLALALAALVVGQT